MISSLHSMFTLGFHTSFSNIEHNLISLNNIIAKLWHDTLNLSPSFNNGRTLAFTKNLQHYGILPLPRSHIIALLGGDGSMVAYPKENHIVQCSCGQEKEENGKKQGAHKQLIYII